MNRDVPIPVELTQTQRRQIAELDPGLGEVLEAHKKASKVIRLSREQVESAFNSVRRALDETTHGVTRKSYGRILDKLTWMQQRWDSCGKLFTLKITLDGIDPPIWRRIRMVDTIMYDLHVAIGAIMGWSGEHMFSLDVPEMPRDDLLIALENVSFQMADGEIYDMEEDDIRLCDLAVYSGADATFQYIYDLGDEWRHTVEIEAIESPEGATSTPVCLDGARACPPEDVGGIWRYAEFLDSPAEESPEDAGETDDEEWEDEEWDGWGPRRLDRATWDPEAFSVRRINKELQEIFSRLHAPEDEDEDE
ncbi:MAG: plasmid pRiA4b ORF-3 family protein [Maioricimonas sp. JB049]